MTRAASLAARAARRLRGDRAGATAVEFAFVSLMLVTLIVGTVEVVRLMQGNSVVQTAVSQTARHAMANPSMTLVQAQTHAQEIVQRSGYGPSQMSFTASVAACPSLPSVRCLTIEGRYTHTFLVGFFARSSLLLTDRAAAPLLT